VNLSKPLHELMESGATLTVTDPGASFRGDGLMLVVNFTDA
jgi:hypothetical protein